MMTRCIILLLLCTYHSNLIAQDDFLDAEANNKIKSLIGQYTTARDQKNADLLKDILTGEIDQVVSSGEWRMGMDAAVEGMMRSSNSNPGERQLIVDKIKFLDNRNAVVDCRYEIKNADGSVRKMWSTFIVVSREGVWKITAIRNMLPSGS